MVLVDHGAANDFIVFYTLSGERLLPMTGGPHDPADPPIVWDVGGTVGVGFSEADCISHGHVGVIIRWPDKHGRGTPRALGTASSERGSSGPTSTSSRRSAYLTASRPTGRR